MFSWLVFKEPTFGKRLKLLRKYRGFTQKELGVALGLSEKTADVRVAQYENDYRTPKKKLQNKIAKLLEISPSVLSPNVCHSCDELMQSLFWLEYTKGSDALNDCLKEWFYMRTKQKNGEISHADYIEWIFTYQSPSSDYSE